MIKKKIILVIFFYFLTLSNSLSIEADVFVQSTVNRASKILSENLSKDEKINKLKIEEIINEKKTVDALSLYWTFLLIVWIVFFLIIYVFNDAVIEWCKALLA